MLSASSDGQSLFDCCHGCQVLGQTLAEVVFNRGGRCLAVSLVRRTVSLWRRSSGCHELEDARYWARHWRRLFLAEVVAVLLSASSDGQSPFGEDNQVATSLRMPATGPDTGGGCPSRPVQLVPRCAGLTRITHHHSRCRAQQKANSLSQHFPLKPAARRRPICRPTNDCGR